MIVYKLNVCITSMLKTKEQKTQNNRVKTKSKKLKTKNKKSSLE